MEKKHDIESRADIEQLIPDFYKSLAQDERIASFFTHVNFEYHMPRMIAFWAFLLFNEKGYAENVFEFHRHLPIEDHHFDIWLENFNKTVDEFFFGEKANYAKQQAKLIGDGFKFKFRFLRQ